MTDKLTLEEIDEIATIWREGLLPLPYNAIRRLIATARASVERTDYGQCYECGTPLDCNCPKCDPPSSASVDEPGSRAEDECEVLLAKLKEIAETPIDWTKTDHHYYAGLAGKFQLIADSARASVDQARGECHHAWQRIPEPSVICPKCWAIRTDAEVRFRPPPSLPNVGDAQEREPMNGVSKSYYNPAFGEMHWDGEKGCWANEAASPHLWDAQEREKRMDNPPAPLPKSEAVKDHHDILRMVRELAADVERDHYVRQVAGSAENLIDALSAEVEQYSQMAFNYGVKCEGLTEENERLVTQSCPPDVVAEMEQEIENLCAEVERLKTKCVDIAFHEQATDALRAENERLREALGHIEFASGDQPEAMNMPEADWYRSRFYDCVATASAALRAETPATFHARMASQIQGRVR